ncbi:MAG: hypothetical protein ABFS21_06610 [Actinomycetota bacterium]
MGEAVDLTGVTGGDARVLRFPEGEESGDPGAVRLELYDEYGRPFISVAASGEVRVEPTDRLGLLFSDHGPGRAARYLEAVPAGTLERITIDSGNVRARDLRAIGQHRTRVLTLGWSGHDRHGRRHDKPIHFPDDPEAWAELRSLRVLAVHGGGFGDEQLRGLGSLSRLVALVLAGTDVTTSTLEMPGLRGIQTLWLSDNETIADTLDFVEALPELQTLGLRNAGLRDRHMRRLVANASIAGLDVGHNRIAGGTLDKLAALNRLWDLDLTGTLVSDAAVVSLAEIPSLVRLKFGDTRLTDGAVGHLGRLGGVTRLWLTRTGITNDGLAALAGLMPQLHTLDISMTWVTAGGTRHLRYFPNLFRLEIAPNQLTEDAVHMLADTTTIEEIGLRGGTASGDLIATIVDYIGALQRLPDA